LIAGIKMYGYRKKRRGLRRAENGSAPRTALPSVRKRLEARP